MSLHFADCWAGDETRSHCVRDGKPAQAKHIPRKETYPQTQKKDPQKLRVIFEQLENSGKYSKFKVTVSYLEIYNENLAFCW